MTSSNPIQFIQQVRTEVSKVVWPARREVFLTRAGGIIDFFLNRIAAVHGWRFADFALVDLLIRTGLQGVLGLFG
ncbi:MAG: preprotein translocase subunit SecE [Rhodobacteraceae bacterium]|nr:preprotein translocase subunit SecE [Paracoccaceae bacterium]